MTSVFTMIINGDVAGHFVWRDDKAVAFMSINPIAPGHTLVVPIAEVDHWIELPPATNAHLMQVAQHIGTAQQEVFDPERIGVIIAGFEVPHTHVHVIPMASMADLDFANAVSDANQSDLAAHAGLIRERLSASGHAEASE